MTLFKKSSSLFFGVSQTFWFWVSPQFLLFTNNITYIIVLDSLACYNWHSLFILLPRNILCLTFFHISWCILITEGFLVVFVFQMRKEKKRYHTSCTVQNKQNWNAFKHLVCCSFQSAGTWKEILSKRTLTMEYIKGIKINIMRKKLN